MQALWAFLGALIGGTLSAIATYIIGIRNIKIELRKIETANKHAELKNEIAIKKEKAVFLSDKREKLEQAYRIIVSGYTESSLIDVLRLNYSILEQNIQYLNLDRLDNIKTEYNELCYICSDENIEEVMNGKNGFLPSDESFIAQTGIFCDNIKNIFFTEIEETIIQQKLLFNQ